jgi:hypothetical protein
MMGCLGVAVFLGKWGESEALRGKWILVGIALILGLVLLGSVANRYRKDCNVRPAFHRMLVVLALAVLFAAPRVVDDLWLNGGPAAKAATVTTMTETYARHDFKPSVIAAGGGYEALRWASKGVSLPRMLLAERWLGISAKSAFGTYGYMNIWAPRGLYGLQWLGALLLVGVVSWVLARMRRQEGAKLVFAVWGTCALVLVSSVFLSWVVCFQPQGRYLLPMVPMIALLLGTVLPVVPGRLPRLLLAGLFALGVCSWVMVGIPGIIAAS